MIRRPGQQLPDLQPERQEIGLDYHSCGVEPEPGPEDEFGMSNGWWTMSAGVGAVAIHGDGINLAWTATTGTARTYWDIMPHP